MIYALLDRADPAAHDTSALETVMYRAAPMSPARCIEAREALGPVLMQLYGQTGSGGIATVLRKEEHDPEHRPDLLRPADPGRAGRAARRRRRGRAQGRGGRVVHPVPLGDEWDRNLPEETAAALHDG